MLIYITLCAYAYKHGHTNAFLYSKKGSEALERNEHIDLTIERILAYAVIPLALVYGALGFFYIALAEMLAGAFAFFFWHEGAYNIMRKKIDLKGQRLSPYAFTNAWKHSSPSSTADINLNYQERCFALLLSYVLLAGGFIIQW